MNNINSWFLSAVYSNSKTAKQIPTYTQFLAAMSLWKSRFLWRYWTPFATWSAISTTSWVVSALGGPSLLSLHLRRNLFMFL